MFSFQQFGHLESRIRMTDLYRMVGNLEGSNQCNKDMVQVTNDLELFCGVCGEQMGLSPESLDPLPCGHLIHGR